MGPLVPVATASSLSSQARLVRLYRRPWRAAAQARANVARAVEMCRASQGDSGYAQRGAARSRPFAAGVPRRPAYVVAGGAAR
ncbi:hypothetical protein ACRAWF_26530 [Streptomyces sp. L7]